ncbi:MAG: serine/threonine protein kinase [Selenomonadaceae bacterium]|nr:serine/threonine protein kinase [Selenomonadaceae bacterium]
MKENVAEYLEFRFEKLKPLKRSERGEVWLASSKQSGELVIIKRVTATGLPYDLIKKFSFRLPAKVFFCAEDAEETVIVEEFIQGENLFERKKLLSESEAREILLQLCDGLKELHAQKIIHRDIKPSNLILQGEKIRLIDFDAARIFKADKDVDTKLLGTKGYAPPEQYGSGQTDQRSDIYSLGVTIKNLLGENCGERLKDILDRCTEYDPKNRFQSVDELKEALEKLNKPETELAPEKSRRTLIFLAIRILWFTVSKNLHAGIIILTIGIFLLASASPLNNDENFMEEIIQPVEKIPEPEKITSNVEKESAQVKQFTLPELITPPQNEIVMPNAKPIKEYTPPPRQIFSEEDLKLPEGPLPDAPSYEPPINFNRKTFSGQLKTGFYLNNELYDQFAHLHEKVKITREQWRQTQARLRITNDTGELWLNPTIKFTLGQNWGEGRVQETKSLPTLLAGESADFIIPFDLLAVSERENTSTYIQIWLNADKSKTDEHYWCVWFDIVD